MLKRLFWIFIGLPILVILFFILLILYPKKVFSLIFVVGLSMCAVAMVYIVSRK